MNLEEIRKHVIRRPFKPFIIHMDNGKTHLIPHPEIIVTESVVVAVDDDGDAVYLAPEAISAISYMKKAAARPKRSAAKRKRAPRTS
jgi:hypothetical protein